MERERYAEKYGKRGGVSKGGKGKWGEKAHIVKYITFGN